MDEILNFNEEEFSLPEYRVKEIKDELQFKKPYTINVEIVFQDFS